MIRACRIEAPLWPSAWLEIATRTLAGDKAVAKRTPRPC